MVWVLAVLVVAAMVGVAVVATGRGEPMRREWPDRPDSGLPEQGPLSADDLRRVRFPVVARGYRMDDVDALLDRLARERDVERFRPAEPSEGDADAASDTTPDATPDITPDTTPGPDDDARLGGPASS